MVRHFFDAALIKLTEVVSTFIQVAQFFLNTFDICICINFIQVSWVPEYLLLSVQPENQLWIILSVHVRVSMLSASISSFLVHQPVVYHNTITNLATQSRQNHNIRISDVSDCHSEIWYEIQNRAIWSQSDRNKCTPRKSNIIIRGCHAKSYLAFLESYTIKVSLIYSYFELVTLARYPPPNLTLPLRSSLDCPVLSNFSIKEHLSKTRSACQYCLTHNIVRDNPRS